MNKESNEKCVLYLCDGDVEACGKTDCYKRGGDCRHTSNINHAINFIHHKSNYMELFF